MKEEEEIITLMITDLEPDLSIIEEEFAAFQKGILFSRNWKDILLNWIDC